MTNKPTPAEILEQALDGVARLASRALLANMHAEERIRNTAPPECRFNDQECISGLAMREYAITVLCEERQAAMDTPGYSLVPRLAIDTQRAIQVAGGYTAEHDDRLDHHQFLSKIADEVLRAGEIGPADPRVFATDNESLVARLVNVAALAVAALESLERRAHQTGADGGAAAVHAPTPTESN
jgi:hypothetical protein